MTTMTFTADNGTVSEQHATKRPVQYVITGYVVDCNGKPVILASYTRDAVTAAKGAEQSRRYGWTNVEIHPVTDGGHITIPTA